MTASKILIPIIALLFFATLTWGHSYENTEVSGYTASSTSPSNPSNGDVWVRASDNKMFIYNGTYSEWLSAEWVSCEFGAGGPKTGTLFYTSQAQSDTTTNAETGAFFGYRVRIVEMSASVNSTPTATLALIACAAGSGPVATLSSHTWNGRFESTNGDWTLGAADTLTAAQILVASVSASVSQPAVLIKVRERVAP